jgi:hypothetical protein
VSDEEKLRAAFEAGFDTRTSGKPWSQSTEDTYMAIWADFKAWCEPEGRTVMPCTSTTLAEYVLHLAQLDRAPDTIRKIVRGIRSWHRKHGQPVPDGHHAMVLLRAHEASRREEGWTPRHTDALTLDTAIQILSRTDGATAQGRRDRCLLLLSYVGLVTNDGLIHLRLRDIADHPDGLAVTADGQVRVMRHWTIDGAHHPAVCPVEATQSWATLLAGRGVGSSGRLIRPVDRHGHIAGVDPARAGQDPPDGAMTKRGLSHALVGLLTRAGVADPERYTYRSLRLGGAGVRRLQRATVDELAAEIGLSPASKSVMLDWIRASDTWAPTSTLTVGLPPGEDQT